MRLNLLSLRNDHRDGWVMPGEWEPRRAKACQRLMRWFGWEEGDTLRLRLTITSQLPTGSGRPSWTLRQPDGWLWGVPMRKKTSPLLSAQPDLFG